VRPIDRGSPPTDKTGNAIVFKKYQEARGPLIERIGAYCSYCEMKLDASLDVEHVRPKKPPGAPTVDKTRALSWSNMLLACRNCNSIKFNEDVVLDEYFWPDRDNTFRAIEHQSGGVVKPNAQLTGQLFARAENTIGLTGLDRYPPVDKEAKDRRWINRRDTWKKAERTKNNFEKAKQIGSDAATLMLDQILETVEGYWSIWMTVFKGHPEVLRRLITASTHPGTSQDCFDVSSGVAQARPGGAI
jgi:uncharacterized protein (TIGR02646 family)